MSFNIEYELIEYFKKSAKVDEAHIEDLSEKLQFLLGQYTDEEVDGESIKLELDKIVTEAVEYLLPEEGTEESTGKGEVS
jgi:hypothetical protein